MEAAGGCRRLSELGGCQSLTYIRCIEPRLNTLTLSPDMDLRGPQHTRQPRQLSTDTNRHHFPPTSTATMLGTCQGVSSMSSKARHPDTSTPRHFLTAPDSPTPPDTARQRPPDTARHHPTYQHGFEFTPPLSAYNRCHRAFGRAHVVLWSPRAFDRDSNLTGVRQHLDSSPTTVQQQSNNPTAVRQSSEHQCQQDLKKNTVTGASTPAGF